MKITRDLHGSTLTELYSQTDFEPLKVPVYNRTFKGTAEEIAIKREQMVTLGWKCKVSQGPGGLETLTCTFAGALGSDGSTPEDITSDDLAYTWELIPNTITVDLLDSDISIVTDVYPIHRLAMANALKNPPETGKPPFVVYGAYGGTDQYTKVLKLWNHIQEGIKTIDVDQPILRKQTTVPLNNSLTSFYANKGRIYSVATLQSLDGLPNNIADLFNIPSDPAVNNLNRITKIYGFRKGTATVQELPNSTIQVSQEWKFGLYSVDIDGVRI